ncbi:MAG: 3'-5' exonuclease [Lewinellaceae bacterium]|nr:3'-5' exonuclease [Lewinellaceae bacterium]
MHYLVIDLEMSGDDPSWHEVIQIGAVLYTADWQERGRYTSLVYPENEEAFSTPSAEVHGLSLADLQDAPMMNEVLPAFENWIVEKMGKRPDPMDNSRILRSVRLAGLGIANDYAFLKAAYLYDQRPWPFSYHLIDVHSLTHVLFPLLREAGVETPAKQSLTALAAYFGMERSGLDHDALDDAVLTGHCLQKLMAYFTKLRYTP